MRVLCTHVYEIKTKLDAKYFYENAEILPLKLLMLSGKMWPFVKKSNAIEQQTRNSQKRTGTGLAETSKGVFQIFSNVEG